MTDPPVRTPGRPRQNPPNMHTLERVQVAIDDYNALVALSRVTGASMAWHRRRALAEYLANHQPTE